MIPGGLSRAYGCCVYIGNKPELFSVGHVSVVAAGAAWPLSGMYCLAVGLGVSGRLKVGPLVWAEPGLGLLLGRWACSRADVCQPMATYLGLAFRGCARGCVYSVG